MSWPEECRLTEDELVMVRRIAKRWETELEHTMAQASFDIGYLIGVIHRVTRLKVFLDPEKPPA